jgi:hypothetical protein
MPMVCHECGDEVEPGALVLVMLMGRFGRETTPAVVHFKPEGPEPYVTCKACIDRIRTVALGYLLADAPTDRKPSEGCPTSPTPTISP